MGRRAWLWGASREFGLTRGSLADFPPAVLEILSLLTECDSQDNVEAFERLRRNRMACLIKLADLRVRISDQAARFERLAEIFDQVITA